MNTKYLFSLLAISIFACTPIANAKNPASSKNCENTVYINENSANVYSEPSEQSKRLVQLQKNQYVCIVKTQDDWVFIKKIKLFNNKELSLCDSENKNCATVADFPAILDSGKKAKSCNLSQSFDAEGKTVLVAKGKCTEGWVKNTDIHYFAD